MLSSSARKRPRAASAEIVHRLLILRSRPDRAQISPDKKPTTYFSKSGHIFFQLRRISSASFSPSISSRTFSPRFLFILPPGYGSEVKLPWDTHLHGYPAFTAKTRRRKEF